MATAQEAGRPAVKDFYQPAALLLRNAKAASLATADAGVPFAALVTVAFLPDLSPVLLLSTLSTHTRQLMASPACALLVVGPAVDENPQTAPRICLSGQAATTTDHAARACFLAAHPYAALYADFADFAFWRVTLQGAHYVGGFAAAAKLEIAKLKVAADS
jgi:putative heme iron utilization protein